MKRICSSVDAEGTTLSNDELVFETVTAAQTSVDPVKLQRAIDKRADEALREIELGFARGSYACALCAAHYANRLARL